METTPIARPLRRASRAPQWWRGVVGGAVLCIAGGLYALRQGVEAVPVWLVPALVFAVAVVLVWSPLESAVSGDARRPDIAGLFSRDAWFRLFIGVVAVIAVMWWFATWQFTESNVVRMVVVPLVEIAGVALVFAPWWLRLIRQVSVEREERAREFERAEIAAHLHDSVLQTLTLIRAKAADTDAVVRLARAQERDLRSYLYQGRRNPDESIASALAEVVSEIEDLDGVAVELVTVGDGPTTAPLRAATQAAREALHNAARHGNEPISVYAELSARYFEVFVRDSGPGFNLSQVEADRLGIANSIIGRVERRGGKATVTSAPGSATEIHIVVPREGS